MHTGMARVIASRSLQLALTAALSLVALLGCAASPAGSTSAPDATTATPVVSGATTDTRATPTPRAPASPSSASLPRIDATCKVDADCAIKDVGSCCGASPACVNANSPTDPAAVQAACRASGKMSTCGFRQIASCSCDRGTCRAKGEPVGGWTDGPQPVPVR